MKVIPILVSFHTVSWIRVAVGSYLSVFPGDRLLVIDNNPDRGEAGWTPECEQERSWLRGHSRIDFLKNPHAPDGRRGQRTHGAGMDVALDECRARRADVMLHLEPDCLVKGPEWRLNLLRALVQGAWMAGSVRKSHGPIHPTPSVWLVDQVQSSFKPQLRREEEQAPRFAELVDVNLLRAETEPIGSWYWWKNWWDTSQKAWFDAAVCDKAALVDTPDIHHYWLGSTEKRLPGHTLVASFPELEPYIDGAQPPSTQVCVEQCPYREDVREKNATEVASCRLLRQITGLDDAAWCEVGRDACEACCELPPLSPTEINPVIASLIFKIASEVAEGGGQPGCDSEKAAELLEWVEEKLDLAASDRAIPATPKRASDPCGYLGDAIGVHINALALGHERTTVFACHHPAHLETTVEECRQCRDWSEKPGRAPPALERILPPPAARKGPRIERWSVGITTAPRREPTLEWCLDSVIRAGWDRPRLFVESAVTIPGRFADLPVTLHDPALGAWPNYYLALVELLMRDPDADAFMLLQDDALLYDREDLRSHLERVLWPDEPIGCVSLYCSQAYTQESPGWHRLDGRWIWGALAFVFPRESVKRFVADPEVLEHRWCERHEGRANIDLVIGEWSLRHALPIYFTTPSLAQHIGDTSTLWPVQRAVGHRKADRFAGDSV